MRKWGYYVIIIVMILLASVLLTSNTVFAQVPPAVDTNPAGNITSISATLNGNLTSLGNASTVSVSFEWGLDTSYGNETTPGNMTSPGPFSADLGNLTPGTTYHFRAKAVGDGTAYGNDMTFSTIVLLHLEGWGWCTDYNVVVPVTFDGNSTMVERAGASNSYSMHAIGNLTLPAPYNETITLDMYGSRVRSLFYLREEVTGLSVTLDGTWLSGNQTYIAMAGVISLPNPSGTSLKTAKICSLFLRTSGVEVPLTEPGTFVDDLESMLSRFVKFIDTIITALIGTGFSSILSSILAKLAVLMANLRGLGIPYIP